MPLYLKVVRDYYIIVSFEPTTGIEPVTSSLPRKRSTPELRRRKVLNLHPYKKGKDLSIPKIEKTRHSLSGRPGSNRRHSAWKADALPTELLPHLLSIISIGRFTYIHDVGRAGFEPAKVKTNRFTVCPRWPLEYLPSLIFNKLRADRGTRTHDLLITNQLL